MKFLESLALSSEQTLNFLDEYEHEIPTLEKSLVSYYGKKPFDLRTLKAAKRALAKKKTKSLTRYTYNHHGQMCMLGAFSNDQTITRQKDLDKGESQDIRSYLIQAKHFDPRTVDALEFANQHPEFEGILARENFVRMVKWIDEQIKRAKIS